MCICFIHQIYLWWRCCPRHPACRNRHVKVPEGPWRADVGAAQRGWRLGSPSIQLVSPVTLYMTSRSWFDLMRTWEYPVDLQHMADWLLLKPNRVLFKYAAQVHVCSGKKCTFQKVKELTIRVNCNFRVYVSEIYTHIYIYLLFYSMTNKCTVNWQIFTILLRI